MPVGVGADDQLAPHSVRRADSPEVVVAPATVVGPDELTDSVPGTTTSIATTLTGVIQVGPEPEPQGGMTPRAEGQS